MPCKKEPYYLMIKFLLPVMATHVYGLKIHSFPHCTSNTQNMLRHKRTRTTRGEIPRGTDKRPKAQDVKRNTTTSPWHG